MTFTTGAAFPSPIVEAPRSVNAGYSYRNQMGFIPAAEYCVFFDDFIKPVATNVPNGWSAAVIDVGATLTQSTTAGTLGATGGAKIASDGTSEGVAIYMPKAIQITSGKRFFMEVRVQTSIAAETDVQFGLSAVTATTNPEDLWTTTTTDLISFGTLAGSAYPGMLSDLSNSGTSVQTQSSYALSDTTWATLAIAYDSSGLKGYVNGALALTWSGTASTTIPTGVALAPFIGARTGATAGNITTFDYVRFVIER